MSWYLIISLLILIIAMIISVAMRVRASLKEDPNLAKLREMQDRLEILFNGIESGKKFNEIAPQLGYSPEAIKRLDEAAKAAVERIEAAEAAYAKMTPEERAIEDKRRIQAGVDFIMDERMGGP